MRQKTHLAIRQFIGRQQLRSRQHAHRKRAARGNLILTNAHPPLLSCFVDRLIRSSLMLEQSMHHSQPQPHPRAAHWNFSRLVSTADNPSLSQPSSLLFRALRNLDFRSPYSLTRCCRASSNSATTRCSLNHDEPKVETRSQLCPAGPTFRSSSLHS